MKKWPRSLVKPLWKPTMMDPDVAWYEGWTLYIKDADLALKIYNAMYRDLKFRVIVAGNVLFGIPKAAPGTHQATDAIVWTSKDMDWDDAGCLVIKDKKLGDHVTAAYTNGDFNIIVNSDDIMDGSSSGDPGGDNKLNAMCPC